MWTGISTVPAVPQGVDGFDAARLRAARAAAGLTVTQVAEATGVVPAAVRVWESGSSAPTPQRVVRLAAALGVDVESLLLPPALPVTLAQRRQARGLLQVDVAAVLGVTANQYSAVERGVADCPATWVPALAELLGVPRQEIVQLIDLRDDVVDLSEDDEKRTRSPDSC